MSIATIVIALVLVFIAWKVLTGLLKIGAILAVVVIAAYLLSQGALA
ncbi:hypothetical protein [Croceibacterium aestuarii]|nr:hypothetical protein [Croceibacterium sp. D39]